MKKNEIFKRYVCCFIFILINITIFYPLKASAQTDLNDSLGRIINYSSPSESFSDMYSSIGLIDRGMGSSGQLVISHGRNKEIFDGNLFTLTFWVKDQKLKYFELIPQKVETKYLPYVIKKKWAYQNWTAESELVYLDNNTVGYYITLKNKQDYPEIIKPVIRIDYAARGKSINISRSMSGQGPAQETNQVNENNDQWIETFPLRLKPDNRNDIKPEDDNNLLVIKSIIPKTDKRDPEPSFPVQIELRTGFPSELVTYQPQSKQLYDILRTDRMKTENNLSLQIPARALIAGPEITIQANEEVSLNFAFSVAIDEQIRQPDGPGLGNMTTIPSRSESELGAKKRWDKIWEYVHSNPDIPNDYKELFAHCVYVLERNSVRFKSQNFGSLLAQYPSKDYYNAHYNWDACLQSLLMAHYEPGNAWDALKIQAINADPTGKWQQFVCSNWVRPGPESQPPIAFWTAEALRRISPDKQALEELYPALVNLIRWWEKNRDIDHDGLYEWVAWLESGWDNSSRWDEWRESGERLEAIDLNSYLVAAYHSLSGFAGELGKESEKKIWKKKAEQLSKNINKKLFDPKNKIYYDRSVSSDTLTKVLTPASLFPLWTGVEIDKRTAKKIIKNWLLSEDHFWGEYGFPCVAFSEPTYEPGYYWRGANWLNLSYWMLCVLDKYGFEQERDIARQRILKMVSQNRALTEYYNSQTGQGEGCPEYGWTAATVGLIIMQKYFWF